MPRRSDASGSAPRASGSALPSLRLLLGLLALLRVFVGVRLLLAGAQRWDWIGTPELAETLSRWIGAERATPFAWHARFLAQSVLPHAPIFTYLLVFAELGGGLLLVLGLLTRLAALGALLLHANLLFATWALGPAWRDAHQALLALDIVLLIAGAGRVYGLDARLARKHPRWLLW